MRIKKLLRSQLRCVNPCIDSFERERERAFCSPLKINFNRLTVRPFVPPIITAQQQYADTIFYYSMHDYSTAR
jgi:hypothetical protein